MPQPQQSLVSGASEIHLIPGVASIAVLSVALGLHILVLTPNIKCTSVVEVVSIPFIHINDEQPCQANAKLVTLLESNAGKEVIDPQLFQAYVKLVSESKPTNWCG